MNTAKMRIAGVLVGGIAALVLTACNSSGNSAPTTTSAPATSTTIAKPPANTTPAPAPVVDPDTATTAPPAKTTTPAAKPKPAGNVIGPKSYGKVKLGMTFAAAKAAGLVGKNEPAPGEFCGTYQLYVGGKADGFVGISADGGVEAILQGKAVSTPEGVTRGWTAAKVKKVYPSLNLDDVKQLGRARVPVKGNSAAVYRIHFWDGVVAGIALQLSNQKCYE